MVDTVSSVYETIGSLAIDQELHGFLIGEVFPGLDIKSDAYFIAFENALKELVPENVKLLRKRDQLKQQLDEWHLANPGPINDQAAYQSFLRDIGYLVEEGTDFEISGDGLDPEVSQIPGPQLVVPINNARYALNAANARWGSLYDALYGNDVISEEGGATKAGGYNPIRGDKVIAYAKRFLDDTAPLSAGSHADVVKYQILGGELVALMASGDMAGLETSKLFAGYNGDEGAPTSILLRHNDLHIDIKIDRKHPVGSADRAGVSDIHLEAALSTIMDCEDSVAAVNAHEKVGVYRNWLGLIKGDLSVDMTKGGKTITRSLNQDRQYSGVGGEPLKLKGRSLMLVRNVGHLMTNVAILFDGKPVPEGIMDAFVTGLIALHDLKASGEFRNSEHGSVYIVKPKMHGPEEVAFACKLFNTVEDTLGMARHTLKIGIMDEERRTSANLKECIRAAKDRIFFINTGFLDRTGDEIHTVMKAGPMIPKGDMKGSAWIKAYEDRNVQVGLKCGFLGKAQIGKGMWAMPDEMARMIKEKVGHPTAGATTAWVPSPTAGTLHALHYHQVDVKARQRELMASEVSSLDGLLTLALIEGDSPTEEAVTRELEQNAQSILGYVVRWIDHGVGCSKVPDINDIGLMEDRATLRISAQHMANWIMHGVCDESQVIAAFEKMAVKVDAQNASDPLYQNMAPDYEVSIAFKAALALVLEGAEQPSGYTEPLLDKYRHMKLA